MKQLGVPYAPAHIANASRLVEIQGMLIAKELGDKGIDLAWDSELTAVIAYLMRLGNQPIDPLGDIMAKGSHVSKTQPFPGAPALHQ
jgi:cbb3-type cytochrome oxidase cytochrome c subunit